MYICMYMYIHTYVYVYDPQIFESEIPVISAFNDSLNACSQLSGLSNSLSFNDIATINDSSFDRSINQSSNLQFFNLKYTICNAIMHVIRL